MMRRLLFLLGTGLLLGGALTLPACTSLDDDTQTDDPPMILGTYEFDGKEYEILSTKYSNDGEYLMFSFSPIEASAPMTTYAAFGIRLYWLGSEVDIQTVYHNDDYIFVYEDPVHYYSQYRRPQSGSYFVQDNDNGNYSVRVDFTLPDGKIFKIDFTGDFL